MRPDKLVTRMALATLIFTTGSSVPKLRRK